jgi:sulfur carrier protein ThiS
MVEQSKATAAPVAVTVSLHADLRRYLPAGSAQTLALSLPPGATVRDVLAAIGIPESETVTAGINGSLAGPASPLEAGDEVTLFSQMEGG